MPPTSPSPARYRRGLAFLGSVLLCLTGLHARADDLPVIEVPAQSSEPVFVANLPVRTQFARAYVPDGGQDAARFESDLARLGLDVAQYVSLGEANLGQALRDTDMVAVLPANLIANPVAGLMDGTHFAFRPTPDGLAPVRITAADGRSIEPRALGPLASLPRWPVTPAEPETALIVGRDLPRAGSLDLLLHNMRADAAILQTLLARSGLAPGRVELGGPGAALAAARDGGTGVLFLSASQTDPEIAALRTLDDLDVWVVTNFGLVPAWPATFGPSPDPTPGSPPPSPLPNAAEVAEATALAEPATPPDPAPADAAETPPAPDLPPPSAPSYSVTDADAVILILPATVPPSDARQIAGVPRALIRELDTLRERRYYDLSAPEFSTVARARMDTLVGPRAVDLQPDIDWLQLTDGAMPQAVVDNLARLAQGLAIRPSDLADPDLAPLLADARLAFWELRADAPTRILDPVPAQMPDSVALSALPDDGVVAMLAAATDIDTTRTESIFTATGIFLRDGQDRVGSVPGAGNDRLRDVIADAAVQALGVNNTAQIRDGGYLHVDTGTGAVTVQPGRNPEPLGDRLLLLRAGPLRDARLAELRAAPALQFHYLAFGRAIRVDAAGDARQIALDAHRVARAATIASAGGVLALPSDGTAPTAFLHHYTDRTPVRLGRLPDDRWLISGLPTAMSPQEAGGRFHDVILGGLDGAVTFESIGRWSDDDAARAELSAAFARDDAAFLIAAPARPTDPDLAISAVTDGLFDGSHDFVSVSRGLPVEIAPLP